MIEINLLPKSYQKRAMAFSFGKAGLYAAVGVVGVVVTLIGITFYQRAQLAELDQKMERARQRAEMLSKDISLVDGLTDVKRKIQNRMSAVEQLDSHRSMWVRVLENVSRNVPEFVWLSRFSEVKPKVKKGAKDEKAEKAEKAGDEAGKDKKAAVASKDAETAKAGKDAKSVEESAGQADMAQRNKTKAEFEGYAFTLNSLAAFMIGLMRSDYFDDVELVTTKETVIEEEKAYNFVLECTVHFLSDDELRKMIGSADSTAGFELLDEPAEVEQLN